MQLNNTFSPRMRRLILILLFIASSLFALIAAGIAIAKKAPPKNTMGVHAAVAMADRPQLKQEKLTIEVPVYRVGKKRIEKMPLEEYLIGVVAAEMPADFPLEALKAQAITARTYLIRRIVDRDFSDVPGGAFIKDSVDHQAYLGEEDLKKAWGEGYSKNREKIRQAVYGTEGMVLTYGGRPITATFFSTSNGRTENADEYWNTSVPYLKSVPSPWDRNAPKYEEETTFSLKVARTKLQLKESQDLANAKILKRTAGGQVSLIRIGGKEYSGRDIRERLSLPSATFRWEVKGDRLVIRTLGYGHGVGMSQWGARGMAEEGKKASQILTYYYKGVTIQDYRDWIVGRETALGMRSAQK